MRKLNVELFFQFGLLTFLLLLMWDSRRYAFESRIYPQVIGGLTIVFLLISLIRHFLEKRKEKVVDPGAAMRRRRVFQISLIVILATVLGFIGGFIVSVLCYYVAYALFQKDRTDLTRTLGIGVALTIVFYISFGWFMKVPLLRGRLINF